MKVITVRQPWAFAIARLGKDVENRGWATAYTGPVLIHAAKGLTRAELLNALQGLRERLDVDETPGAIRRRVLAMSLDPSDYVRGAVVAVAELTGCKLRPMRGGGSDFSPWHTRGAWGHRLSRVKALKEPVPWKGMLGYVNAPPQLIASVKRALES